VAGYGFGLGLTALASIVLLRYLGVVGFGRFATVTALTAVIAGLTDAGLTVVGQREYVLRETPEERHELLGDLLGLRMALTPAAIGIATLFAWAAGYSGTLVLGTAVAGAGVIFINAAAALTVPLSAALRLGAVTLVDVARQVAIVIGVLALVPLGATLGWFFAVYLVAGMVGALVALALVGPANRVRPTAAWSRWMVLLRESAPIAAGLVVNVFYVRALIIAMSVLSTGYETGLFAASYRVVEIFIGVPAVMAGAAFPILAHAGAEDEDRLAYALQRLVEASLLIAVLLVLCLTFAAEPIIKLLGGSEYDEAAPVLRLQSISLLGAFLTQVWILGLVAIRRRSALLWVNGVALAAVAIAGGALIGPLGAQGAALAAVVGEAALALVAGIMLVRTRPALRPDLSRPLRILFAGALAATAALLVDLSPLLDALVAAAVFVAVAFALRAVPTELAIALRRR
jgi:O-antigen/teichoic acid export membrane protein